MKNKAKTPKKKVTKTTKNSKSLKNDIVELILEHHKPLKKLIKILKDSEKSLSVRRKAFEEFAPTLLAHAKAEEKTLYVYMKMEKELREEALEGDVEHNLADETLQNAKTTKDEDLWSAQVKVLAELVEHHIEEEEEELLPHFKKNSSAEDRTELGERYLELHREMAEESTSIGSRLRAGIERAANYATH